MPESATVAFIDSLLFHPRQFLRQFLSVSNCVLRGFVRCLGLARFESCVHFVFSFDPIWIYWKFLNWKEVAAHYGGDFFKAF
jgi:hypothetical protein